jgi:hypothetical protein
MIKMLVEGNHVGGCKYLNMGMAAHKFLESGV